MSAATRVPPGCKNWCAGSDVEWSTKCVWRKLCGGCPQCVPTTSMQSSTTVKTTATTRGLSTASTASRTSGTLAKSSTTGDVSTASTTFTTTMQSNTADGCDSWCVGHAQSWEDKCTWDTCNTCPECPEMVILTSTPSDVTTKSSATFPIFASNTQNESKPNTTLAAVSNNSTTISTLTTATMKARSTTRSAATTSNVLASTVEFIDNFKGSDASKTQVDILLISVIIGIAIVILLLVVVIVLASVMKVTLQNKKKKDRKSKKEQHNQKSESNDARVDVQNKNTQITEITDTQGQAADRKVPPKLPELSPTDPYQESAYTCVTPSVAYSEGYSPSPRTPSVAYTEGYSPALAGDAHSRVSAPHSFLGAQYSATRSAVTQNTGVDCNQRYYDDPSYTERYEDMDAMM